MKQSVLKRCDYRHRVLIILIIFVVGLTTLLNAKSSVLASPDVTLIVRPATVQESKPLDNPELTQGAPIERELRGGEAHSYRILLSAGQYLRVTVEQKGIDVVFRLFGSDGQKLTEVDSPNGTQGPEPISFIAQAPGSYRLEVVAQDKSAAPARYAIKIETLRDSTALDRDRIAAETVTAEVVQLRAQGTAASLRKALERAGEALPLWRSANDLRGEASALFTMGVIYWELGDSQKSLESYTPALSIWRSLADLREEARTLHSLGVSYSQLGENRKALEYYSQALPLRRATEDRQGEGITLNSAGLAHNNLGELRKALESYNQALSIQRAIGRPRDEATTLSNIGSTYFAMGYFQEALEHYSQALPLRRATGDRRGEAATLNNIGVLYWQLGENEKALEYHNEALPLRRSTGDRNGEFSTLQNFGVVHLSLGESQKALEYHNQALTIVRALGDRRGEASTLQNIGTVYRWLNDLHKALEYYDQALLLRRAVADRRGEANTLSRIGTIYSLLGEPVKALTHLEQALSFQRAIGDAAAEAATLQGIARAERDRGRLSVARAQIEAALKIIESARSRFINQQLRTSFLASMQSFYELYIDLLMQMHWDKPSSGYDALALQASERARARSLLETLIEGRTNIREGVDPALLREESSLRQQLNAKSEQLTRLLGGKHTEEQEAAVKKEVDSLVTGYQEAEAQIRARSSRYAALTQPQPLGLKEIQQVLDEDTVLLEYALGEQRSYLWAVTATSVTSFKLPKRADIEAAAMRVYEALTARNKLIRFEKQDGKQARIARTDAEYFVDSMALSKIVLEPVVERLGRKRLLIVSDGSLQYVPFGGLPIPGRQTLGTKYNKARHRPLITEHEIVSLPSASTLALLRKELVDRPRRAKTVVVFADPVFQDEDPRVRRNLASAFKQANDLSVQTRDLESEIERSARDTGGVEFRRLPFSRQEAEGIAALTPKGMRKESLDFEASREAATSADLINYRIIHFATHGLLNSRHPELSGIVLSLVDKNGKPQDGFLRLHEIYNMKLGADLVVLSACRTALGKQIKGEGLIGITRGFMYAGAPRVVASLWAVDDEVTAELMKRFYRQMLVNKQRPAAALRAAQVGLWNERRLPPYFWAAFILLGEWQ